MGLLQNVDLRHSEERSDEESRREEILRFAQNDGKRPFRNSPIMSGKGVTMRLVITLTLFGLIILMPQKAFSQPAGAPPSEESENIPMISTTEPPAAAAVPATQPPAAGIPPTAGSAKGSSAASKQDNSAEPKKPFIEIKKLSEKDNLFSLELRDVDLADLFRIIAHDYQLNILVEKELKGKVTASFTNISLEEALEQIAQMNNITLEKTGNVILVKPRFITKIFILKNIDAKVIVGEKKAGQESGVGGSSPAGGAAAPSGAAGGSASPGAGNSQGASQVSTIYNLLSPEGKVFLGDQPNSLMVIDYPANVEKVEAYLNMADQAAVNKKEVVSKVFKLKYVSARDMVIQASDKKEDKKEDASSKGGKDTASSQDTKSEESSPGGKSSSSSKGAPQ